MYYQSHFSDKTYFKKGISGTGDELWDLSQARRAYGIIPIGECWVRNEGIRLMFEGPEVDEDTQNLLCLQSSNSDVINTLNKV